MQEKQAREEIFEEGIPLTAKDVVHYYGGEGDLEDDQDDEGAMEPLEPLQSSIAAARRNNHINQFLKLPKICRRPCRRG